MRYATIGGHFGLKPVKISIVADGQRWRLNDQEATEVEGCTDLDLGFSPSTNLLPIRRLALEIGDEAELEAAWLPFPALKFARLPQKYVREDARNYKYESRGGSFSCRLETDGDGFVTNYPALWKVESVT